MIYIFGIYIWTGQEHCMYLDQPGAIYIRNSAFIRIILEGYISALYETTRRYW